MPDEQVMFEVGFDEIVTAASAGATFHVKAAARSPKPVCFIVTPAKSRDDNKRTGNTKTLTHGDKMAGVRLAS
jgi:hypothetical protein